MYAALNSDPSDPDVIIKLDISNAFNVLCRQLTLDVLGGKASCDYACGLKEGDNIETVCEELRNMFDDDVFYLFLQKQNLGAKLHIYL
jgi:hypothetical protein